MQKKQKSIKKKPASAIKTIQIKPGIAQHDINVKAQNVKKLLEKGNKVDVELFLRGRELSRTEYYIPVLESFVQSLGNISEVDVPLKTEGRKMIVRLRAKKK